MSVVGGGVGSHITSDRGRRSDGRGLGRRPQLSLAWPPVHARRAPSQLLHIHITFWAPPKYTFNAGK